MLSLPFPAVRLLFPAVALLFVTCSLLLAQAGKSQLWHTDYQAALLQATEQKRPILLEFTGSDWCPPCMMMKKEVLSTTTFESFAGKNLVLVELDFPQRTSLPAKLEKQNQELVEKFGVRGFPTFILLNAKGKEITRWTGFQPGGPSAFVKTIEAALKK